MIFHPVLVISLVFAYHHPVIDEAARIAEQYVYIPILPPVLAIVLCSCAMGIWIWGCTLPKDATSNGFFEPQEGDVAILRTFKTLTRYTWPLTLGWYLAYFGYMIWIYQWRLQDRQLLLAGMAGVPGPLVLAAEFAFVWFSMYCADVVFGLFHFYFDQSQVRPGTCRNPVTNHWRAAFQRHHRDPVEVFKVYGEAFSPLYTACETIAFFCLYLPVAAMLFPTQILYFFVIASPWIFNSQPIHYYNHAQVHGYPVPQLFIWMQRMHLVMQTPVHQAHHRTFDINFAVTNGWSNPLLNLLYSKTGACDWVLFMMDVVVSPFPLSQIGLRVEAE